MARLIPSWIDDTAPQGERDVFNMLSGAPDSWVVLHSLDLAPWNRSKRTELDFVVIIPDVGILCIEVKSHDVISFDGSRWSPDSIKRSPFKQALDASHTLHRRLKDVAAWTAGIPKVHMCIFPNARFEVGDTISVGKWELMDIGAFRACRTAAEFGSALKQRTVNSITVEGIAPLSAALAPQRVADLVSVCLPIQKRPPGAREESMRRRSELDRVLRDQQKPVLRLFEGNDRLLVTGAAGTGKTLIAMELALREAERGRRVALLSFNSLIGKWMAVRVSERKGPPNLVVDSAYRMLTQLFGISVPTTPSEHFWDEEVPRLVEERLTDPEVMAPAMFDTIILDEAQDFLARPHLWDCITAVLDGGLENGRFAMFGDLDQQVLSGGATAHLLVDTVRNRTTVCAWHLAENCRNTRIVGEAALVLSGYSREVYAAYLRTGGSPTDIGFVPFLDAHDQGAKLKVQIQELRGKGYKDDQITILSFCGPERCVARRLVKEGFRLRHFTPGERSITFASVHAYKGLESEAIILSDIDLSKGDASRALFYTALTRSTGIVKVLCRQQDSGQVIQWWKAHSQ